MGCGRDLHPGLLQVIDEHLQRHDGRANRFGARQFRAHFVRRNPTRRGVRANDHQGVVPDAGGGVAAVGAERLRELEPPCAREGPAGAAGEDDMHALEGAGRARAREERDELRGRRKASEGAAVFHGWLNFGGPPGNDAGAHPPSPPSWAMSARPFIATELTLIAQRLQERGDHRTRALLLLGANTGFRITELLSLRWSHLLAADGSLAREVTVARQSLKGGRGAGRRAVRSRTVRLNGEASGAVADYLGALPRLPARDEPVFRSREGGGVALSRAQAHRLLKAAVAAAGFAAARLSTHSMRKSFVGAIYAASGHDLIRTQRVIGHRSPLTTAAYLESTQDELDQLVLGLPLTRPAPRPGIAADFGP